MNPVRLVGIVMVVLGVVLFVIGLNASESAADQISNFFTGKFTDKTMWYMVGGAVMALAGGLLAVFGGRRVTH